jgi:hypothetical protein
MDAQFYKVECIQWYRADCTNVAKKKQVAREVVASLDTRLLGTLVIDEVGDTISFSCMNVDASQHHALYLDFATHVFTAVPSNGAFATLPALFHVFLPCVSDHRSVSPQDEAKALLYDLVAENMRLRSREEQTSRDLVHFQTQLVDLKMMLNSLCRDMLPLYKRKQESRASSSELSFEDSESYLSDDDSKDDDDNNTSRQKAAKRPRTDDIQFHESGSDFFLVPY